MIKNNYNFARVAKIYIVVVLGSELQLKIYNGIT